MWKNFPAMFLVLTASVLSVILVPEVVSEQNSPQRNIPQSAQEVIVGDADMIPGAPDFELKDLNGKTIRLQDFRGKAVALNFWATWCVPCKTEMPWLNEFQKQYGKDGFVVVGIAMDGSSGAVRKFITKMNVNYPIVMGTQAVADQYQVKGYPLTFYIDRYSRITDQVPGLATRGYMENEIRLALMNGAPRRAADKSSVPAVRAGQAKPRQPFASASVMRRKRRPEVRALGAFSGSIPWPLESALLPSQRTTPSPSSSQGCSSP